MHFFSSLISICSISMLNFRDVWNEDTLKIFVLFFFVFGVFFLFVCFLFFFLFMRTDFIRNCFYWNLKFVSNKRWNCTKILYKYFQQALTRNPIFFCFHFVNSRHSYPSLVTHIRTRCSFCPIILAFFPVFVCCIDGLHCYDCNMYVKWRRLPKSLRKIQIWLKTLMLMGKSSKMAPNSERLSPEWNKLQEP